MPSSFLRLQDRQRQTQPCNRAAGLHPGPPSNWLQWLIASEPQFPCLLSRSNTAGSSSLLDSKHSVLPLLQLAEGTQKRNNSLGHTETSRATGATAPGTARNTAAAVQPAPRPLHTRVVSLS